jgi:hypothetical protein
MRVTLLQCAAAVGADVDAVLLPLAARLAGDRVANVRMAVALLLRQSLEAGFTPAPRAGGEAAAVWRVAVSAAQRDGAALLVLRQLVGDADPDVREVASVALTHCV